MAHQRAETFSEFWTIYVQAHRHPGTRWLHFVGTTGALLFVIAALVLTNAWLFAAGVSFGYACAWSAHLFVEKNRPATFGHPLWSLAADFRMFGLMLAGRMDAEVARASDAGAADARQPAE